MAEYFSVCEENDDDKPAVAENPNSDWGPENKSFKRPRKGRSEVWKYFDLSRNQELAKCRMCGNIYKTSRNTTNLFDHLKRCSKPKKPRITKIPAYTKSRKTEIDCALTRMIAVDVQPFRIVEDEGFRNFIKCLEPRYELPTRKQLQNVHLKNMFDEMATKLLTKLNDIKHCAITTGWWTSRANESYLSVTCHFVSNDYKLQSAVLSTSKLACGTSLFAENIAETLHDVLSNWNVLNKVVSVVTDNTATMTRACDLIKIPNLPCFAHTLNLVVQDVLALKSLKFVLTKCKRIVAYFKSNTIAYDKFRAAQGPSEQYSLVQEQTARWNSAFKMCNCILLTKDTIASVLQATPRAPQMLNAKELELLEDLCDLLSLLNDATHEISADSYVTISLIIPIAFGLCSSMSNLKNNMKTSKGLEICNYLIESLQQQIFSYESTAATRISTLLDPRFKKDGFRLQQNADLAAKALEKEMLALQKTHTKVKEDPLALSKANVLKHNKLDANVILREYFKTPNKPKDCDPLQYWKFNGADMDALNLSAVRYLCIPATTTESERMFDKAGEIFADRRSTIKSKYVDMLLFVRKNQWLKNM